MPKMNITDYMISTYNNIMEFLTTQKQSQTKPNLPAIQAGKFALSLSKGPLKTLTSAGGGFDKKMFIIDPSARPPVRDALRHSASVRMTKSFTTFALLFIIPNFMVYDFG
jgi:hypothetical protein